MSFMERLEKIKTIKEKELLSLLSKINNYAKKIAEYMYENMEIWYELGFCEECEENELKLWKKERYPYLVKEVQKEYLYLEVIKDHLYKLFKILPMNFETFDFDIKKFNEVLKNDVITIKKTSKKSKNNFQENFIMNLGMTFFIYYLLNFLTEDLNEIKKNEKEYYPKVCKIIDNIYRVLLEIFREIPLEDCLHSLQSYYFGENLKYIVDDSCFWDIKEVPIFKVLRDDNIYIQMIIDKKIEELIKEFSLFY